MTREVSDSGQPGEGTEVYGAAAERTALAWQRTGLGVVVGSFLIFQTSLRLGVPVIGWIALALGIGVAVRSRGFPRRRYRRGRPADSWELLSGVSTAVVALAVLGTAIAVMTLLA